MASDRSFVSCNQADLLFPPANGVGQPLYASGTKFSAPVLLAGNLFTGRLIWTGTPTGTFKLQTSYGDNTWTDVSGTFSAQPAGSASSCTVTASNLTGRYVRVFYTATSGTGTIAGESTQHDQPGGSSTSAPTNVAPAPQVGAANAWSVVFSTGLAAKLIIKATAGNLRSISGRIDSTHATASYYLQLWNLADVPADATATSVAAGALMAPFKIQHVTGTDSRFVLDFAEGIYGSTGLVIGLSTTEFTKTASGSFLSATAEYK